MTTTQYSRLNEVQFPKELQRHRRRKSLCRFLASMKCSSQRNCNQARRTEDERGEVMPQ